MGEIGSRCTKHTTAIERLNGSSVPLYRTTIHAIDYYNGELYGFNERNPNFSSYPPDSRME